MAKFDLSAEARDLVVIDAIVGDDEGVGMLPETTAFLFAEFADSDGAVLRQGVRLWQNGVAQKFVLCDGTTAHGAPPCARREEQLHEYGVPFSQLVRITNDEVRAAYNTLTEARACVRHAREMGYTEGIFVAARFHLLRTAMTVVGVVLDEYPEFRAYFLSGRYLQWNQEVTHSQGVTTGRRWELLRDHELSGILNYPNMPLPSRVLEYLVARWR
ncbi:MAG: hypothetical protein Q8R39_03140 [bacterium]|nr:hypothetical protein [bacterium]MDZ4285098.1 hypothetical protein [Patescibacteria group bacterium]